MLVGSLVQMRPLVKCEWARLPVWHVPLFDLMLERFVSPLRLLWLKQRLVLSFADVPHRASDFYILLLVVRRVLQFKLWTLCPLCSTM